MKKLILLSTILLLSGCCTQMNYARKLSFFVGQPEINLIATLGHPLSMYPMGDYKSLEYHDQSNVCLANNQCELRWCTTQFFVKNDIVENFNFKGNNCCAYDY